MASQHHPRPVLLHPLLPSVNMSKHALMNDAHPPSYSAVDSGAVPGPYVAAAGNAETTSGGVPYQAVPRTRPPSILSTVVSPTASDGPKPSYQVDYERDSRPARSTHCGIFSSAHAAGNWVVPKVVRCRCIFGGVKLDFRNAVFVHPVTTINCSAIFGGVKAIVPVGVQVEICTFSLPPLPAIPTTFLHPRLPDSLSLYAYQSLGKTTTCR